MIKELEWQVYKREKRKRLKNKNFSIISSNCSGTYMYYDLKLPYTSPTVNLSIGMNDFVRMVQNLEWYMERSLTETENRRKGYPVGMLGDVEINFVHYDTFSEAAEKWEKRKKRIHWNNLFIIGTEKDGCTYETLRSFEQLPYKNKVIFTHVRYPEFPSAYCIKGFEEEKELGDITGFQERFLKRQYLDDFDYVGFLNGEDVCER